MRFTEKIYRQITLQLSAHQPGQPIFPRFSRRGIPELFHKPVHKSTEYA